ncbi:MAG: hypothetical protein P4L84_10135 [Isosphaeraceae bacterium]|nr:hypothetical protein [Isosphaeraceae bacterium]
MDRHRFVPSTEALDQRTLLSSTGLFGQSGSSSTLTGSSASTHTPDTFNQKLLRIERIPYYLDNLQSKRFLSPATLQSLQTDILAVAADLHPAPPPVLRAFNLQIRKMLPKVSLSPQDVAKVNNLFGLVIRSEGATEQQVANLQKDMLSIAKADAASPNSVYLATNDYSIMVQGVSIIGRPIETPANPVLALGSGVRLKTAGFGGTRDPLPTFVGTYRTGSKVDPGTRVEISTLKGEVLGSGTVILGGQDAGHYRFTLDQPLQPGINWLRIRAVDAEGHLSTGSSVFAVKLVTSR